MVYIISSPTGEKIRIQFDESKKINQIKVTLVSNEKEISKNISFRKDA